MNNTNSVDADRNSIPGFGSTSNGGQNNTVTNRISTGSSEYNNQDTQANIVMPSVDFGTSPDSSVKEDNNDDLVAEVIGAVEEGDEPVIQEVMTEKSSDSSNESEEVLEEESVEEKGTTEIFDFFGVGDRKAEDGSSETEDVSISNTVETPEISSISIPSAVSDSVSRNEAKEVVETPSISEVSDVGSSSNEVDTNSIELPSMSISNATSSEVSSNISNTDNNSTPVNEAGGVLDTNKKDEILEKQEEIPDAHTAKVRPDRTVRYNPVTGEEMNLNELKEEIVTGEKLKKVEVEYKPPSKANTFFLILFFVFLLGFIIYLPDITAIIDAYKSGNGKLATEEIPTGKLVCTLETNTVNLDKTIERVFYYERLKLKSSKFSTTVRGDSTLDEESLNELYAQCNQIKENVKGLDGISVSCELMSDKLIEKESFDYSTYNIDRVTSAYAEAGGTVVEFEVDQDIDKIMSNMKRSGFRCNKEK